MCVCKCACKSVCKCDAGTKIVSAFVPKFPPFFQVILIFSPFCCPPVGVDSVSERSNPTLLFKIPFRIHFLPPFFIPFLPPFQFQPKFPAQKMAISTPAPVSDSNVQRSPDPVPNKRIEDLGSCPNLKVLLTSYSWGARAAQGLGRVHSSISDFSGDHHPPHDDE